VVRVVELTLDEKCIGQRLDAVLARLEPSLSRAQLQRLIASGVVQLAGKPVKASQRVKQIGRVRFEIPEPVAATPQPEAMSLRVLHEDSALIAVNKPAGMLVHPGAGQHAGTLVNGLLHHIKDLTGVGGVLRPGIVHRLDKDTSGVLVVAKSDKSLRHLQAQFKKRSVTKVYLALVHGVLPERGTFDTPYGRHPTQRLKFSGRFETKKRAITHFTVLARAERHALVEVLLETGRTHQIRVHFAEAGHPLVGDKLYGRPTLKHDNVIDRQALHALSLTLKHPRTAKPLTLRAPPPQDFLDATRALLLTAGLKHAHVK
jgi:23S rRNA pseudouridine1911/1915/1917 synthase